MSALLCGATLVVAHLLGRSEIGGRPVTTLIGAAALAASAILASMITADGPAGGDGAGRRAIC